MRRNGPMLIAAVAVAASQGVTLTSSLRNSDGFAYLSIEFLYLLLAKIGNSRTIIRRWLSVADAGERSPGDGRERQRSEEQEWGRQSRSGGDAQNKDRRAQRKDHDRAEHTAAPRAWPSARPLRPES